jgi:dTDP-4-dehydrorhamnose reductase
MAAKGKKLLLVGGKGMLANRIVSLAPPEYALTAVDLPEFDITDQDQVVSLVDRLRPEIVINCAAYTNVDGCETEQELANRVNGDAVGYLAAAAKNVDAVLVHVSTDYVFDGKKKTPYVEDDPTNPQSAYGRSKLLGEQKLLASGLKKFFIVRTSWLYGPGGKNFVETILRLSRERQELGIVADQFGTPTYTGDLAEAIFNLLALNAELHQPPYGTYHFSNNGSCSWYEFANEVVTLARHNGETLRVEAVRPIKTAEYPLPANRPAFSVFSKVKYAAATGALVPDWKVSLAKYCAERSG